jgi:hypothetical protein
MNVPALKWQKPAVPKIASVLVCFDKADTPVVKATAEHFQHYDDELDSIRSFSLHG